MTGSARRGPTRHGSLQQVLDVLRADGPSSQATIARRTGLSPATVNNVVKALRSDGVAEIQPINGREALVGLVSKQGTIVSVRVGVDALHGAVLAFEDGKRHDMHVDVRGDGGSNPAVVIDLVGSLAEQAGVPVTELAGAAFAVRSPIDRASGAIASWAANRLPGWKDVPLADTFSRALGVPVVVDNDVNLAALAEWTWGVGRGTDAFLYVASGEGIGGGIILDGKVHRGGNGMAGEIGHVVLEPSGAVCHCGGRGCLSTLASERAILLALRELESPKQSLEEVIDSARQGDPACQRVLFEAGRHLGRALASVAKVLAPSAIAIGGTLSTAGALVLDGLWSSIEVNNLRAVSPSIRFLAAQVTADAPVLGGVAAVLADLDQGVSELSEWMTR